jgi:FAD binding domain
MITTGTSARPFFACQDMVRLGNPGLAGSVYGGGKRVFRLDFTRIDSRYHYILFLSQAETERILRTAIEKQGVRIERGVELVGLAQDVLSHDPNPVKVVLRHADGRPEQAQAPWLISAEGAHSTVRATLDLQFEGNTRDEQYALGDLHVDGELVETDFHTFSSEHGFMGLFPMGKRRFRLIASNPMSKPSKDTAPALEELQAIYDQRSHIPARFRDMSWSSWFRINSRMVPRLKVGRLLLGGDAAHVHSPAGAQGMNTGIQDMINLAWRRPVSGWQSHHARLRSEPENDYRCDELDLEGCQHQKLLAVLSACICLGRSMEDDYRASQVGPGQADRRQDISACRCCRGTSVPRRGPPVRTGTPHDLKSMCVNMQQFPRKMRERLRVRLRL